MIDINDDAIKSHRELIKYIKELKMQVNKKQEETKQNFIKIEALKRIEKKLSQEIRTANNRISIISDLRQSGNMKKLLYESVDSNDKHFQRLIK